MKLYDFDGIFEEQLSSYIQKHMAEHSEKEWEDIIPNMYQNFADTVLDEIGMTPTDFYMNMSKIELVETLKEHLKQEVPVSDILCSAIEEKDCIDELITLLDESEETILHYAVNLLGNNEKAFDKYLEVITREDVDKDVIDGIIDAIKTNADVVKDKVLAIYKSNKKVKNSLLEILSRVTLQDEEIYTILVNEFRQNLDDIPMYASFLAEYGDERALPILMNEIERNDINYVEFQELLYGIEKLGGEYKKARDFSNDPFYKAITSGVNKNIFEDEKN